MPAVILGPLSRLGRAVLAFLFMTLAALSAASLMTHGAIGPAQAQAAADAKAEKAAKKAAKKAARQQKKRAKAAQKAQRQQAKAANKAAKQAAKRAAKNKQRAQAAKRQAQAAKRQAQAAKRNAQAAKRNAQRAQRQAAQNRKAAARANTVAKKRRAAAARKQAAAARNRAAAARANAIAERNRAYSGQNRANAARNRDALARTGAAVARQRAANKPRPAARNAQPPARRAAAQARRRNGDLRDRSQRRRLREVRKQRRQRRAAGGNVTIDEPDGRSIVRRGGRSIIRNRNARRLNRNARDVRVVRGTKGRRKNVVTRANGTKIITEFDANGRLLRRTRRGLRGRDVVLIDNHPRYRKHRRHARHRRHGLHGFPYLLDILAPRVHIPHHHYIVDSHDASYDDIYDALSAPPVDDIDDVYTLDEVRYNHALRARMRRIDINTINFDFGSWYVDDDEYDELEEVARAIKRILRDKPDEIFFVEGHTDAIGTIEDNLSLSDRRAEAVAVILTDEFSVPSENLVTQGYGEEFLKVRTQSRERRNRRVTVRRITPLIKRNPNNYQNDRYSSRGTNPWNDDYDEVEPRRRDDNDFDDDSALDNDDERYDNDPYDWSDNRRDDNRNRSDSDRAPWDQSQRPDEDEVYRFVADQYLSGQELTNNQLRTMYAPRIDHFGRRNLTISRLIQKKQEYYDRWPDRRYELDEKTLRVKPGAKPGTYDVTFEYTFDVRGKGRVSRGRGKSNLVIAQNNQGLTILREDGKVLQRN